MSTKFDREIDASAKAFDKKIAREKMREQRREAERLAEIAKLKAQCASECMFALTSLKTLLAAWAHITDPAKRRAVIQMALQKRPHLYDTLYQLGDPKDYAELTDNHPAALELANLPDMPVIGSILLSRHFEEVERNRKKEARSEYFAKLFACLVVCGLAAWLLSKLLTMI